MKLYCKKLYFEVVLNYTLWITAKMKNCKMNWINEVSLVFCFYKIIKTKHKIFIEVAEKWNKRRWHKVESNGQWMKIGNTTW